MKILLIDNTEEHTLKQAMRLASESLSAKVGILGSASCDAGFDSARRQWRADIIIEKCLAPYTSPQFFLLGLTGRDLYVPSLNFIFGLARIKNATAIVSWHRLQGDDDVFVKRIAKEIVHEVGHLEGLLHCRNATCVMAFSNALPDTDRKGSSFCDSCRRLRSHALS